MGATLPVLISYINKNYANIRKSVSILYFANTLGSAAASFFTAEFLFPNLGLQGAVLFAVALNILIVILVSDYSKRLNKLNKEILKNKTTPKINLNKTLEKNSLNLVNTMILAMFSGYLSLSIEILMLRYVGYSTGGSPRDFAHVLGYFLLGIALSSFGFFTMKNIYKTEF